MFTTQTQTIHKETSTGRLDLRPEPTLQLSPATPGFPITGDIDASPFKDVQTGDYRTVLPIFSNPLEERQYRKEHLALVFRIFHRFKMAEGIAGMSSPNCPASFYALHYPEKL